MKRQFVSDVGVFSIAYHARKAEDLIALVKSYEHSIVSDKGNQPDKVLFLKVQKLCATLDKKFPRTMPLLVEHSRHKLYGGMMSKISVKPSRRDGSFSDIPIQYRFDDEKLVITINDVPAVYVRTDNVNAFDNGIR